MSKHSHRAGGGFGEGGALLSQDYQPFNAGAESNSEPRNTAKMGWRGDGRPRSDTKATCCDGKT